jgi:hypothetical protein
MLATATTTSTTEADQTSHQAITFSAGQIPHELQGLKRWVLWRYEWSDGHKPSKVPYQPNGAKTRANYPNTWHDSPPARRLRSAMVIQELRLRLVTGTLT